MLPRLAAWCYRRRRFVVISWIVLLIGVNVLAKTAGGDLLKSLSLPGTESQKHVRRDEERLRADRRHGLPRVQVERRRRRAARRGVRTRSRTTLAPALRKQKHVASVDDAVRPGGARFISQDGKIALRRDPVRRAGERRSGRPRHRHARHRRRRRTPTRSQIELGGSMFTDQTQPDERADRHPRRGRHPVDRVRIRARDGPADHDRAVRHRHRARDRHAARALHRRPVVRAAGHRDDRHRRRYRLRAVHQHALSRGAARRHASPSRRSCTRSTRAGARCCSRAAPSSSRCSACSSSALVVHPRPVDRRRARGAARDGAPRSRCCRPCSDSSATRSTSGRCRRRSNRSRRSRRSGRAGAARSSGGRGRSRSAGSSILLVLAIPALGLRLGIADAGNDPTKFTTRRAYDLLSEGFGPGFNGPLLVASEVHSPGDVAAMAKRRRRDRDRRPASRRSRRVIPSPNGKAVFMQVVPKGSPQDESTTQLVHRLRDDVIPHERGGQHARRARRRSDRGRRRPRRHDRAAPAATCSSRSCCSASSC